MEFSKMDIVSLIISLVSGAIGGNIAGKAMPDKDLGTAGNSIVGLLGGGATDWILKALGVIASAAAANGGVPGVESNFDITSLLVNVGSSGVGGAVLTAIVGLIKQALEKR
jgi:uncharacterized membrane protein YeaQ/YmgE (transglycosylase-associated protein family)